MTTLANCSLEIGSRALQLDLINLEDNVDRVGTSQSLGGIEVHLTRWIQAFGEYLEVRELHTNGEFGSPTDLSEIDGIDTSLCSAQDILSIIADNEEKIMLSVESVLNVLHEETDGGVLIPRIRHHLNYSITVLAVNFLDHTQLSNSFLNCHDREKCNEGILEGNRDLMPYLNGMVAKL